MFIDSLFKATYELSEHLGTLTDLGLERTEKKITRMEASIAQRQSLAQVVIVGGGFGGLSAAKEFAGKGVSVTLIDKTNHHLFHLCSIK